MRKLTKKEKELRKQRKEHLDEIHQMWEKEAGIVRKVIRNDVLTEEEDKALIDILANNFYGYRYGDLRRVDKIAEELRQQMIRTKKKNYIVGLFGLICVIVLSLLMILHILGVL